MECRPEGIPVRRHTGGRVFEISAQSLRSGNRISRMFPEAVRRPSVTLKWATDAPHSGGTAGSVRLLRVVNCGREPDRTTSSVSLAVGTCGKIEGAISKLGNCGLKELTCSGLLGRILWTDPVESLLPPESPPPRYFGGEDVAGLKEAISKIYP